MKIIAIGIISLLLSSLAFAIPPTTLSNPKPAIAATYKVGDTQTVTYTVTNNVPQEFPLTVTGIYGPIKRTTVANDCGNKLHAGPSTCKIGITISPTHSGSVSQTLLVGYAGRTPLSSEISFKVLQSQRYAYLANQGNDTVSICKVNPDGSIEPCTAHTDPSFKEPVDIVLNKESTIAYVYNSDTPSISICTVETNGMLADNCTVHTDPAFDNNFYGGIRINNSGTVMYVTTDNSNQLTICPINSNGSLGTCSLSNDPALDNIEGRMGINLDDTHLYIGNYGAGNLAICPLLSNGLISGSCTINTDNGTYSNPGGVDVNPAGTLIYIANETGNSDSGTVSICPLTGGGSTLGTCVSSDGNGAFDFDNSSASLFIGDLYAYMPNPGNNTLAICPIKSEGTFGTCTSNSDPTFDYTPSVWISNVK